MASMAERQVVELELEFRQRLLRRRKADEWMAEVRAWAASHPQRDFIVDDSREANYGDRL